MSSWFDGCIQPVKYAANTVRLPGVDAFTLALGEEALKLLMAEPLDHRSSVM